MNEHLDPVFKILLPGLEKAGISYWVFGGVSVAAYAGEFVRTNKDVDIFVKDNDFEKAESILKILCIGNNFYLIKSRQSKGDQRPKIDIKISGEKRFSVIPVYQKNNDVLFKYPDGDQKYSNQLFNKIERNISSFRFFTPPNAYIKELFINHIKVRPGKKSRLEFKEDARAILTPEDFAALDWSVD